MSKANRRYYRSIMLGVVALAALVWVAAEQFGIPHRELFELFLTSLLVLLLVISAAGSAVVLWLGLRNLWRRLQG